MNRLNIIKVVKVVTEEEKKVNLRVYLRNRGTVTFFSYSAVRSWILHVKREAVKKMAHNKKLKKEKKKVRQSKHQEISTEQALLEMGQWNSLFMRLFGD